MYRNKNRQHGMWVAHHIIKQHGGKEIDDAAYGLHTASSNNIEGKK